MNLAKISTRVGPNKNNSTLLWLLPREAGKNLTGGILSFTQEEGQELLKIKVTRQGLEICLTAHNGQVTKI